MAMPKNIYTYDDDALKEQKMKPIMLVGSSYALTERHHNKMYITQELPWVVVFWTFSP